ncbi:TPA: hypothetical protein ON538_000674 [Morganella morganii]|nr:hypothetical protein [Morganella morganii]HCR3446156.1 hypothetical protein [Morganella morganii]
MKNKINNTFNTNVHGNANIANASENFNQNIQLQSDELINRLVSELLQLKVKGKDMDTIDAVISHVEDVKQVKDKKSLMSKLTEIMTIAGGAASVYGVVVPYIPMLSNLFG